MMGKTKLNQNERKRDKETANTGNKYQADEKGHLNAEVIGQIFFSWFDFCQKIVDFIHFEAKKKRVFLLGLLLPLFVDFLLPGWLDPDKKVAPSTVSCGDVLPCCFWLAFFTFPMAAMGHPDKLWPRETNDLVWAKMTQSYPWPRQLY